MSALVGLGVTVTLSLREGAWSDVLVYKSADTTTSVASVDEDDDGDETLDYFSKLAEED